MVNKLDLMREWQKENTISRNATEEAECFLRWLDVALAAETDRCVEAMWAVLPTNPESPLYDLGSDIEVGIREDTK